MRNFIIALIIFMNMSSITNAQNYKFGKVSQEELLEKVHPKDSFASAAILNKTGKIYLDYNGNEGWSYILEVTCRVKIYKTEGYKWATERIPIYVGGNNDQKIISLKGFTYNLDGNSITKEKLRSEGEFIEKVNRYWEVKKFTMPNVKEGSVVEWEYSIKSPYITFLPEWNFQYKIPVNNIEYKTFIPEYFTYNERTKGYLVLNKEETKSRKSKTVSSRTFVGTGQGNDGSGMYEKHSGTLNFIETRSVYSLKDLPALRDEKYVNNIDNYRASIKHELSFYRGFNNDVQTFATNWDNVVKKIYQYDDFGGELAKTGYFESDIDAITNGVVSNTERVALIFNHVKSKMNWNNYNGYSCNDGVRKAYKENVGNTAEINLMLTSMLRYAGLDANPVLVSTRNHGIPLFPTREGFNYVICAVNLDGNVVLLDATSKYAYPNILPEKALNWFGRLVKNNGSSSQIDLMPANKSKQLTLLFYSLLVDGSVEGKIKNQLSDQNAFIFRDNYDGVDQDDYLEKLENEHGGIEVSDYKVENVNNLSKHIIESYSFLKENAFDIIGDKFYISPLLFFTQNENPFKLEKREYPIDYSYPRLERYLINIKTPEGYKVETLPEGAAVAMPDELGVFKYNISNTGNSIQLTISHEINSAIIPSIYYDALKEYYSTLIQKETEKIVFTKL